MLQITALYENECMVSLGNGTQNFYINSTAGREKLFALCQNSNCPALFDDVKRVWGEAPTVKEISDFTIDDLKTQKKAQIAVARYNAEIAGTTVNGVLIDTGRDSQALITGAALAAMLDDGYSLNWKTESGFIHLSAPEIIVVAQAVRAHVQSCFDKEGELVAQVDAAQNAEELDAIEITFE